MCQSMGIELESYMGNATPAQVLHLCAKAYAMIHQSTLAREPLDNFLRMKARARMQAFMDRLVAGAVVIVGQAFCDDADNPPDVRAVPDVAITVHFRFADQPLDCSHWMVFCAQEQTATILRNRGIPVKSLESYGAQSADLLNTAR